MKLLFDENLSRRLPPRIADGDFYELAISLGHPPKVIFLMGCNYGTAVAERLIRGQAIRIAEFLDDPERAVLILQPH